MKERQRENRPPHFRKKERCSPRDTGNAPMFLRPRRQSCAKLTGTELAAYICFQIQIRPSHIECMIAHKNSTIFLPLVVTQVSVEFREEALLKSGRVKQPSSIWLSLMPLWHLLFMLSQPWPLLTITCRVVELVTRFINLPLVCTPYMALTKTLLRTQT